MQHATRQSNDAHMSYIYNSTGYFRHFTISAGIGMYLAYQEKVRL